jgi:tetratricopeptide (TPR) repeat protein
VQAEQTDLVIQAEQAFEQGQYEEVLQLLSAASEKEHLSRQVRFLQAYALFHLKRLEQAAALLDAMLAQQFSARVALLRGLVAFARQQWPSAQKHLQAVIDAGEEPYVVTAKEMIGRVEEAIRRQHHEALRSGKKHLEAGRLDEAERDLERAEQALPGQVETRYYSGYLAYKRKKYLAARRLLHEALGIDAGDEWSRYMLAMTELELKEEKSATTRLEELASTAKKRRVRKVAQEALARLEAARRRERPSGPFVRLELGSGLDTNPGYIDEISAERSGLELHAAAQLEYQHWLARHVRGRIGLSGFERGYGSGGGRSNEQTEGATWATLGWSGPRFDAALSYSYSLLLYGHEPLYSEHGGYLELGHLLGKWFRVEGVGRISRRVVHDQDYDYLRALVAGGTLGARFHRSWLTLGAGYEMVRQWADPMLVVEQKTETGGQGSGPGGPPTTIQYTLSTRTDYTLVGHGPFVWSRLRLPWRLALQVGVGIQWRLFDNAGTVANSHSGTIESFGPRRDLRISLEGELVRSFASGVQLALRLESVDNRSSLAQDEWGLDRTYSRWLAGLALRWIYPAD